MVSGRKGISPTDKRHGTSAGYVAGCRCARCRRARAAYMREYRLTNTAGITPQHVHGTANGYQNYGCRCDRCTEAADVRRRGLHRPCTNCGFVEREVAS
jgi:hypothetical protein